MDDQGMDGCPSQGWPARSAGTLDQLAATIRNRLCRIQRQPALIKALLGQTGRTLESQPP